MIMSLASDKLETIRQQVQYHLDHAEQNKLSPAQEEQLKERIKRQLDEHNAVIVAHYYTSPAIQALAEEGYEAMKEAVMEVVGQHFRPEFINRVDEMVVFHPLSREQIREIAAIQLGNLRKRLESNGYGLSYSDAALDLLGEAGFDPVYGARPLKRAIQNEIENPLAQKILASEYAPGDTIEVDAKDGSFTFG